MNEEDLSVADTLEAAADYLRTFGKVEERYGSDGGPRCIIGAFSSVVGIVNTAQAQRALAQAIVGEQANSWNTVTTFSDQHSKATVVKKLMETAADLRLR